MVFLDEVTAVHPNQKEIDEPMAPDDPEVPDSSEDEDEDYDDPDNEAPDGY